MHLLLYTWSSCSFCARASALLDEHGVTYETRPVDGDRALVERLARLFGKRTMPFVLLDGEPYGGLEELERGLAAGELG